VALCPLHDEDTPSFRYYDETNTFYCFGCRAGGDVINLHRKFMGQKNGEEISFIDAVKFIKEYFIDGKELAGEVKKLDSKQAKESLSTVPELLVYSNYVDRLEKKLMRADKRFNELDKSTCRNYSCGFSRLYYLVYPVAAEGVRM